MQPRITSHGASSIGHRSAFISTLEGAQRLDLALYSAFAATTTPALERALRGLSIAENYSRISIASAAALGVTQARRGREAAIMGLESVAVTAGLAGDGAVAVGVRSRTVVADNAAERFARGLIRRRPRIESP